MVVSAGPVRVGIRVHIALLLIALVLLAVPLLRSKQTAGAALLAVSLFVFPNGLNPVSSMMVIPLLETTREILILVVVSWVVAALDALVGGFGGLYLVIVLVALAQRTRRLLAHAGREP